MNIRKSILKNNVAVTFDTFASIKQMVFWVPNRTQEHMVDALAVRGDEGRGVAAKSSGEACSNL